ncbi:hypothetical protein, partial [Viscerimonas tarda]
CIARRNCRGVWHTPDTRIVETRKCFIIACILIVVCWAYAIRPVQCIVQFVVGRRGAPRLY